MYSRSSGVNKCFPAESSMGFVRGIGGEGDLEVARRSSLDNAKTALAVEALVDIHSKVEALVFASLSAVGLGLVRFVGVCLDDACLSLSVCFGSVCLEEDAL